MGEEKNYACLYTQGKTNGRKTNFAMPIGRPRPFSEFWSVGSFPDLCLSLKIPSCSGSALMQR